MTTDVIRSTASISRFTALSRALGLVREILMATTFGTSLVQSAFVVAFTIPNLFRRLFGEGALSAAFIPIFTESLEKESRERAWVLAHRVMTLSGMVLAAICIAGVLLIGWVTGGASLGPTAAATLPLLRIMLPYMFFICMVALAMGVLNSFHHFAVPAATPVILNGIWIGVLLLVCPRLGATASERIYAVAWGVLIAGIIQLAAQLIPLWRHGYRPRPMLPGGDPRVWKVLRLMGPAALGMGVMQLNVVMDRLLAFLVGTYAPAALSFSDRLVHFPLGIFAAALGTVLLPVFSGFAARSDTDAIRRTLNESLRAIAFVMVPASVGLAVLATPIIRLSYAWPGGAFGEASTVMTMRALVFYAPGLLVFSVYKVFVPAFYAMQDTRTPVRVGVWSVLLNFVLNMIFICTWPEGYKHAGLALATVLSSVVSCGVLAYLIHRKIGSPGWPAVVSAILRTVLAAAVMGGVVAFVHPRLSDGLASMDLSTKLQQLVAVLTTIGIGMVCYLALARLLCRDELATIWRSVRRRPYA
jgi:putative peptidoglycan lipid II flippase